MQTKRFVLVSAVCALMHLFLASAASAGVLEYDVFTDLTSFTQAAGMTTVYDFEDDAVGTSYKTHDFGDFAVDGSSLYMVAIQNVNTRELYFNTSKYTQNMAVSFHEPITAFGFDWRNTDSNTDMVRVDFDDTRYVLGAKDEAGFWGVVATKGIISNDMAFLFGDTSGGAGWTQGNLDNFRYGTGTLPPAVPAVGAPEPTVLSLVGLGGLALFRRRRDIV